MSHQATIAWMAALTLAALASRLVLIPTRLLIENDGPFYVALAEQLLSGDWSGALNDYWSQLYPVTIAFVTIFIDDTELAARLVSAMCGAALVPAIWMLVNEMADPLSATLATLLAVFQPWLIVFSVLPLTEMLFTFLVVLALTLILRAGRLGGLWRFALAGCLTALAVLTRSEGLLLVVGLLGAGVVRLVRHRNWQAVRESTIAFAVLLFVMAPQTMGTYHIYGHFNFFWKSSINLALSEAFNNPSRAEQVAHSLTDQGNRQLNEMARESSLGEYWLLHSHKAIQSVWQNIEYFWRDQTNLELPPMPYISGIPTLSIWVLAALGIAKGLARERRGVTLAVFGFVTVYSFGLFSVLVHHRLLIPLIPFILSFVAIGCVGVLQAAQWISVYLGPPGWKPGITRAVFLAGSIGLLLVASSSYLKTYTLLDSFIWEPVAQKEAGLWLHDHVPQTEKIISHNPQTPLYFYDGWPFDRALSLPWATPEEVLIYARNHDVSYIVLEEWIIHSAHFPVETWLETNQPIPGLKLVQVFGVAPYRVIIYDCTD